MRKRTRAREFALQILYQLDLSQSKISDTLEDFWQDRSKVPSALTQSIPGEAEKLDIERDKKDEEIRSYAEELVRGTIEKLPLIDKVIERFAENWTIKRMAYVDRNILRLSTYEMIHRADIPMKVSINEAVELAKRYGESDSSKFVNGILDKIAKTECKQ